MPSAREVLEKKVGAKHAAVSDLAAEYLRHACKLGASTDGKVAALCRKQLQPFFQLSEDVLTSLELSSIEVRPEQEKAQARSAALGPVLSPVSPASKHKPQAAQMRYYFDQEDTALDEAFVQFARSHKKELVVTCPAKTHLRRRRYIRVLGTAISRHVAQYPSFTVRFKPAQLNGIAALACLGFYLAPKTSAPGEAVFLVKRAWPSQKRARTLKKLPSAQKYQFATVWVNNRFRASYFDLVKGEFRWAWRDSPFKAEVGTRKRRGTLRLIAVSWPDLQALPLSTKVYGEAHREHGATNCFFGTVGDMLSKRALLQNDDAGAKQLDAMSVFYMDPRKPAALTRFLNKREDALPTLLPACLNKLPETALKNFAQVWTDKTINLVKKVLSRDPDFVQTLVARVPEDLRGDIVPSHGPHSNVDDRSLTVAKILALYPSLTDELNK